MKNNRNTINGWINLDKPLGITSADAVNKVKWLLKPQKIGHAGTLDPLATGVLPLALGEGTKCINLLMDTKKTYEFSVTFGERRTTDDAQGEVIATSDILPSVEDIRAILPHFTGEISQVPPVYSALKVSGKRAYDLARAGEIVILEPRQVTVYELEFLGFGGDASVTVPLPLGERLGEGANHSYSYRSHARDDRTHPPLIAHFRAQVSKGTYIRSLGRDMALKLGCEGYISRLHRSAVGPFEDANAISLDFLEKSVHKAQPFEDLSSFVMSLHAALDDIPALALTAQQLATLRYGQQVRLNEPHPDTKLLAVTFEGELAGLTRLEGNQLISIRLLNKS